MKKEEMDLFVNRVNPDEGLINIEEVLLNNYKVFYSSSKNIDDAFKKAVVIASMSGMTSIVNHKAKRLYYLLTVEKLDIDDIRPTSL